MKTDKPKMTKDIVPCGFTPGLALVDAVPVVFFGISFILLGKMVESFWFFIGALLCTLAGAGKVLWKIIVAKSRKNIWPLFIQMRVLMPAGFLIMLLSIVCGDTSVRRYCLMLGCSSVPSLFFFIFSIICMVLMIVCAVKLDSSDFKSNWIEQIINSASQISFFIGLLIICINGITPYSLTGYRADDEAVSVIRDASADYAVETNGGLTAFVPDSYDRGVIIYPGARVEATSYATLAAALAQKNILCVIAAMPFNYAFLGNDAAEYVMDMYPGVSDWYIAGHSLGGVMAAYYAADNADSVRGVILLASYSTADLTDTGLKILSVYGSEDGVLNMDSYHSNLSNLPSDYTEVVIQGGCHAYFASYGEQKGDGSAQISRDMQITQTAEAIALFVK